MFDGISSEVLAVIFLAAMIFLYRRQQTFITLLKYRFRLAEPQRVERSILPAQTAQLLDGARQELEAAGFRYEFTESAPPLNLFDPRPSVFSDFYWNPEKSTLAVARLAEAFTGQAVSVYFLTAFADRKKLLTTNRILWSLFPALDEYVRQDAYADNFWAQWECHQKAQEKEASSRAAINNLDEVLQLEQGSMSRLFTHLQSMGWINEESHGIFRLTARGAWRYAHQQIREAAKARADLKRPYRHSYTPDVGALRSVEINAFAASIELAAQPMPQWLKAVLFGLTLLASVLLFGREISFVSAIALLLVHEMGHLIAMWAFGFRNLSILFLPFLGAVAMGHKSHVKPWQEAIILLAGPVPGLLLALILSQITVAGMSAPAAEFLRMSFWFALLLNLFNLLPLSILDGGKLFQLAVLSRFPYVRVIFSTVGSVIGLLYALVNGSMVLAIVMVFLLMAVSHQFRGAQAVSAIRARAKTQGIGSPGFGQLGKEEAIALLGQHLAQPEFSDSSTKGWLRRTTTASIAYPRLLQGVPGIGTSLGVLTVHSFAFFAPLLMAAWLVQQPGQAPIMRQLNARQSEAVAQTKEQEEQQARAQREKFMAAYNASNDPQEKWAMLDAQDDEDALPVDLDRQWVEQQRDDLLPRLPADHPARLQPLLNQAMAGDSHATELILSVIAQLTQGDGRTIADLDTARFYTLMSAFHDLEKKALSETLPEQNALLESAWVRMENLSRDQGWRKRENWRQPMLASTAAHLAFAAGNPARAEMWMARNASHDGKDDLFPALNQAWFQLDLGHANLALEQAARAINTPGMQGYLRDEWLALAGWAEMSRDHPREADAYFVQALHSREAKPEDAKKDFNVVVWLLGIIQGSKPQLRKDTNGAMLNHLAALEGYDPQQAARFRAELADKITPEWKKYIAPYLLQNLNAGGWGQQRGAMLGKILDNFETGANQNPVH